MKPSVKTNPNSRPRHIALLAGAGTGKTTRIIEDIAKRIGSGKVAPSQILALTFSRKATQEMRERLKAKIGSKATFITVNTFHGFAAALIRQYAKSIELSHDFTVLHEGEAGAILKDIIGRKVLPSDLTTKKVYEAIDWFINRGKWPESMVGRKKTVIKKLFNALQAELRANNSTTFSGLIVQALHLLRTQPQIRTNYTSQYRYIYVDEFQDTSIAQYKLLKLLAGERTKFFVVGDDDQSIYSWRHVRTRMVGRFRESFDCIKTKSLVENHRSSAVIVRTANGLISHNESRDAKQLIPTRDEGELVRVHRLLKQEHEAKWIVETIVDIQNQPDGDAKTIVILCRHRPFFKKIEKQLKHRRIAYHSFDKKSAHNQPAIKLLLNYLRALTNTKNAFVIKQVMKQLVSSACVKQIEGYAALQQLPFWEAAIRLHKLKKITPFRADFIETFIAVQELAANHTAKEVIGSIIRQERFNSFLRKDSKHQKAVDVLIANIPTMQSLDDFVNETIDGRDVSLFMEKSTVQLMTIHAAKGLEFSCVFLPAWERDRFPYHRSENMEEERRLAYVAITRAKERLFISHVLEWRSGMKMKVKKVAPSPFIKELPADSITRTRSKVTGKWIHNKRNFVESAYEIELDDVVSHNPYQDSQGKRINHGVGVVVEIQDQNISIELDDGKIVKVKKSAVTKALLPEKRRGKKSDIYSSCTLKNFYQNE